MFDFKTYYVRWGRLVPGLVFTLFFVMMVELAFRARDWFHDYDGWESPALQQKMQQAEKVFEENGRLDLVTLSTSIGRVWDVHQWEEATSGALVGYNFGYPDQRPERQYFLFKNHIWPRYKPKYVIYGLGAGDTNSNIHGMDPRRPRQGPFWTYRSINEMEAQTALEKAESWLEEHSYLFRSRRRARFELQYGKLPMLQRDPTIGSGILAPTVRRQAFGPMELSWGRKPEGLPINDFHNYWIPDDGEIGELIKLGEFCRKQGVEFVVLEFPTSPYSYENFDDPEENYGRFLNALDFVESKGIRVLRMGQELKLDNTYYEDQAHMNRWGGQAVTNYVYERVIRQWFPEQALAETLPQPVEVEFAEVMTSEALTTAGLAGEGDEHPLTAAAEVRRVEPVGAEAQYEAPQQVVISQPMEVDLGQDWEPGHYAVEIYAGDGTTTSPEISGEAKLELAVRYQDGAAGEVFALKWINTRLGISYTQANVTLERAGRLKLRVTEVGQRPVILDVAFVRRRLSAPGPDGVTVSE